MSDRATNEHPPIDKIPNIFSMESDIFAPEGGRDDCVALGGSPLSGASLANHRVLVPGTKARDAMGGALRTQRREVPHWPTGSSSRGEPLLQYVQFHSRNARQESSSHGPVKTVFVSWLEVKLPVRAFAITDGKRNWLCRQLREECAQFWCRLELGNWIQFLEPAAECVRQAPHRPRRELGWKYSPVHLGQKTPWRFEPAIHERGVEISFARSSVICA